MKKVLLNTISSKRIQNRHNRSMDMYISSSWSTVSGRDDVKFLPRLFNYGRPRDI